MVSRFSLYDFIAIVVPRIFFQGAADSADELVAPVTSRTTLAAAGDVPG